VFDDSEFEQNLFKLRQEKLQEIVKLGQAAYPNQFPATHTVPEVRAQWGEATAEVLEAPRVTVAVAGRIMAIRAQGKAGFATLQQGGQRLQIYIRLLPTRAVFLTTTARMRMRHGELRRSLKFLVIKAQFLNYRTKRQSDIEIILRSTSSSTWATTLASPATSSARGPAS